MVNIKPEFVERHQIQSISQLATYMNHNGAPFSICAEAYFFDPEHTDGLRQMQAAYGFAFDETALVPTPIEKSYRRRFKIVFSRGNLVYTFKF